MDANGGWDKLMMHEALRRACRGLVVAGAAGLLAVLSACASGDPQVPTVAERDADKFLLDRGTNALERKRWEEAREYFRRLIDTYPQSPHRQDAKLGIGDSYLGEPTPESHVLAANEFREFLTFYPVSPRADYAQYKLAQAEMKQMLSPQRDQTGTINALRELERFVVSYPNSPLMPEVLELRREARDRLSEHEFLVGRQYYRTRWYPGAIARLEGLLKADPEYTGRDGAYFYLGEALRRSGRNDEARAYYEKLIAEFKVSDYLEDAAARAAELTR